MKSLKGSCSCGAVEFRVKSRHDQPYQLCYCSICRKTQGGGGFAINLSADARTLKIKGKKFIKVYRALVKSAGTRARRSTGERNFCGECGSALWLFDPAWPELLHPFASAIDTPLPTPPSRTHLMLEFKPEWVDAHVGRRDQTFDVYPRESIAAWHERRGLAD